MAIITIQNYPNYKVSDTGQVFNSKGKELSYGTCRKRGYLKVWLYNEQGRKEFSVHRLVALHFVTGDKTLTVNHKDHNKLNNTASNLEWITNAENIRHSYAIRDVSKAWKTRKNNSNLGCYSLSESETNAIKELRSWGLSGRTIAKALDRDRGAIANFIRNLDKLGGTV